MEQEGVNNIIKSISDKREYKHITLENQLQVLLIHDSQAEKSSASLDVFIGQLEDPAENQGIAHFCEHMLFMGTKKYPVQNEYSAFISKNSGFENAFTDLSDTNYYFDIATDAFDKGLDMFAQFFISPLFSEDCVDKEIKAVDSEHQNGLMSDDCRNWQLFKETAHQSSFKQNGGGNLKTLQKEGIRDDLIKFYNKYYSANLMKLVVYSNQSIEWLENSVRSKFSEIENKNVERPRYKNVPYDEKNLQKLIKLVPIRDEDTLELLWVIPSLKSQYKKKVCEFICSLLGTECINSLTTFLIDEGLITDLVSYHEDILDFFTVIGVKFTLTEEGFDKFENIIAFTFKYLQTFLDSGIQEWQFNEQKQIEEIAFRFLEKKNAADYVTMLSQRMQQVPIQDILKYKYIFEEFDKELIENTLKLMNTQNMQVYLSSHNFEEDEDFVDYLTEEHYETRYQISEIPEEILDLCKNFDNVEPEFTKKKLGITIKNEFIPQNFDLISDEEVTEQPEKVYTSELSEVWFMKDNKYEMSKAWSSVIIYTNDLEMNNTVDGWVKSELWLYLFDFYVQEMIDMANSTYLKCEMEFVPGGLKFKIKGYNDKFLNFIQSVFTKMSSYNLEKDHGERIFEVIKSKMENDLQNFFKDSPERIASNYSRDIYMNGSRFPYELKLSTLEELEYGDFQESIENQWLNKFYLEWFFYGNLRKNDVVNSVKSQEEILKKSLKNISIEKDNKKQVSPNIQVIDLNKNEVLKYVHDLNKEDLGNTDEPNSALQMYFQGPIQNDENTLLVKILKNYISEPFFDQLRTNEQLGYSVDSYEEFVRGIIGFNFSIQSSVADPNKLAERTLQFLQEFRVKIQNMEDKDFNGIKQSVLLKLTEKELNLQKQALHYYKEIYYHQFQFNKKEKYPEIMEKLTKQQFQEFFESLFYENNKRIEVHVVSKEHGEIYKQSNNSRQEKNIIKEITDIIEYKQKQTDNNKLLQDQFTFKF